ncbi:MAG: acyl-CoA dehydratase activase [Clostridia bacterium]|nr:acyl-CoA dehydratase activase [Clostridia bacterium]
MRVLGIDLGSRAVKIAIFENRKLDTALVFGTAEFYREFCTNVKGQVVIDFDKLNVGSFDKIISTGYGRNNVNVTNAEIIVELKAHTFGAVWQTGLKDFILLDIGGQDSKVIFVKNAKMADMVLNDKCAASCGRYLENMANVLGMETQKMQTYYQKPVVLNSTCAVFGETELIGRISEGYPMDQLAAGVNYSLFQRIKPLIGRFSHDTIVLTGGVAHCEALIHFIKTETGFKEVVIPEKPQLNGAIGCCAYELSKN